MKYGTISSGIEAHSLASVGLGDEAVFFSDIAPGPCKLLPVRFPSTPNLGDMTRIDYDPIRKVIHNSDYEGYQPPNPKILGFNPVVAEHIEIPAEYGEVELVCGGTPCTDASLAGKRKGAAEGSGTRSSLAFQHPRIGKALGARWILFENVPGIMSSNGGRDVLWFFYRCMEAGYSLAWRTLDAQYIRTDTYPRAVPQRRRRVFMVGFKGDDWRVAAQALFEPMSALGSEPPTRTVGKGFLSLNPEFGNTPQTTELEEFEKFLEHADERYIAICKALGIAEDPSNTLRTLRGEANKKNGKGKGKKAPQLAQMSMFEDLFGEEDAEPKHQGKGLEEKDLDLKLPTEGNIRDLGLVNFYSWCRDVSQEIGFCGELFQGWKYRRIVHTIKDDPEIEHFFKNDSKADNQPPLQFNDPSVKDKKWEDLTDEEKNSIYYELVTNIKDKTDEKSVETLAEKALTNIGNAGIISKGIICTMKVPEWNAGITKLALASMAKELADLYDGDVCGLSDVLEKIVDPKYYLSWRVCYGILRRAKGRGKLLPIELAYALVSRIIDQAPFVKFIAENGKRGEATKDPNDFKPGDGDIAEVCYKEVIESILPFAECVAADPKKSGIDDDDLSSEDGGDDEGDYQPQEEDDGLV